MVKSTIQMEQCNEVHMRPALWKDPQGARVLQLYSTVLSVLYNYPSLG